MNIPTKTLLASLTALPLFVGSADAAVINSTGTVVASFDAAGHQSNGTMTGDFSYHTDGLQFSGWVGAWGQLPTANTSATERSGSINGVTFKFNTGGAVTISAWKNDAVDPGDLLRKDYYYTQNSSRYSGPAPWEISGLTPGTAYDLILYNNNASTDAAYYIPGFDAGNGAGVAVTLDSEGDANFQSVVADGSGKISGFMDDPTDGGSTANFAGLQVAEVPEPGSLALLGLGSLLIARRRRG